MLGKLKNTSLFYFPYFGLFALGFFFFFYWEHGDFVLLLNDAHSPFLNSFFKWYTYTGDGFFFAALTILIIFLKRRYGLILGLAGITQGLISLVFKQVFYEDTPRPSKFFEGKQLLDLIEGVKVQDFHSFPSGHTMTAFVAATFIALMLQNNSHSLLMLIAAVLTGISRIFLGQHFLIDVMAGSLIGVFVSTFYFFTFEKYLSDESKVKDNPDEDLRKMDLGTTDVQGEI